MATVHSLRWQPLASPRTRTYTHTQWAGERSAHQRQTHWPAHRCFKAPINFFPTNLWRQVGQGVRGGRGGVCKCHRKATRGENIWGLPYFHYLATATHNEWWEEHSWDVSFRSCLKAAARYNFTLKPQNQTLLLLCFPSSYQEPFGLFY